jgi:methionine synthase I (cobalamin-dependent)
MADYKMEEYAYELNYVGAHLARQVCDEVTAQDQTKPYKPHWIHFSIRRRFICAT